MPKISWNNFIDKNEKRVCFLFQVSKKLPKAMKFDANQKLSLTPYSLILQWSKENLTGEWSSQNIEKNLFAIVTSSKSDSEKLINKFGTRGTANKSYFSDITFSLNYNDSNYKKLANELGYVYE